jgi:hypothetical protein
MGMIYQVIGSLKHICLRAYLRNKGRYMRICGLAADALHTESSASGSDISGPPEISEGLPYESLHTYWRAHPKHIEEAVDPQLLVPPAYDSSIQSLGAAGKMRRPLPSTPRNQFDAQTSPFPNKT